jgi:hypothetical protein
MKIPTRTISHFEAAVMIAAKLGTHRNWGDFLSDNIRGKQSIKGETLMPCSEMKTRGLRPRYAIKDVQAFIAKVLALSPGAVRPRIKAVTLMIDTARHWTLNKFDRYGTPISRMHGHTTALARP